MCMIEIYLNLNLNYGIFDKKHRYFCQRTLSNATLLEDFSSYGKRFVSYELCKRINVAKSLDTHKYCRGNKYLVLN